MFACHATSPPDQHCNSTGVLTSAASAISPISGAAHHVVFSVWLFFATFGDAVSQVGAVRCARSFLSVSCVDTRSQWTASFDGADHHLEVQYFAALAPAQTTLCGAAALQASQTFLPASIGFPPAAWRFARQMAVTGIAIGLVNSFGSGALCDPPAAARVRHVLGLSAAGMRLDLPSALCCSCR